MAAPKAFLHMVTPIWNKGIQGTRRLSRAVDPEGSQQKGRTLLQFLADHFYDIQALREYLLQRQTLKVHQKNRSFTYIKERYGPYVASAYFILKQGGAVKFQGKEWTRPDRRGRISPEFLAFRAVPVEAVDASECVINYQGLDNICEGMGAGDGQGSVLSLPRRAPERPSVPSPFAPTVVLKELQSLWLQRCPHVDDWCLSRLHQLADSLQELSLAGCPRISERGLACLHHLRNLRRLDISDLPAVSNSGLVQILVEEMLPNCEVLGADWAQGLKLGPEEQSGDTASPIPTPT
ncbi:hypothetical protein MC885_012779 [Smutsia gigantea]|nr:hypothetical protein MC885_012779 [Smutsia gigantea]